MPYLKAALQELIVNENYSFGGQKEAYLKALEQAYETHRGKPIQIPRNLTDQHKVWKRFLSDKSFEKSHYEALEKLAKDIFDYTEAQNEMLGA